MNSRYRFSLYQTAKRMSLKFNNPASFLVSGSSGSGKTVWTLRFISHLNTLCPEIKCIYYYYEVWQQIFAQYTEKITFRQGLPTLEQLKDSRKSLIVLDDLMFADATFLAKIYSVYSHHYDFTVVMTVQNIFRKNLREVSLNTNFIVLFKNCRDSSQISTFLRQIYPQTYKNAMLAYKDAVSTPRGYLLLDLRCETHDSQRLRTCIFPGEVNYIYQ